MFKNILSRQQSNAAAAISSNNLATAGAAYLVRFNSADWTGEIIGEMSLVDPAPTTVAVRAATDATLLRIPDAVLREKLAGDMGFAARFYRALCVFLADRMRHTTQRMGYGAATDDAHAKDELNEDLLDNVHLAGARFDRMLKRLAG